MMNSVLVACGLTLGMACAYGETGVVSVVSFDGVAEATPLDDLPGWSPESIKPDTPALVVAISGYHGPGARFSGRYTGHRLTLPPVPEGMAVCGFRFKLRVMAVNDAWTGFMLRLGNGTDSAGSGLALRFIGGKRDSWNDNLIQISRGGQGWKNIQWSELPNSNWSKEHWYQVSVMDIDLADTRQGETAAWLTVTDLSTDGEDLVFEEPVGRIGASRGEDRIEMCVMGNTGVPREVDVDEIELLLCPVP